MTSPSPALSAAPALHSVGAPIDPAILEPSDGFVHRHLGPSPEDIPAMLATLGYASLDELSDATVPAAIRLNRPLRLEGLDHVPGEHQCLDDLAQLASLNEVYRSCIGAGYYDTITPPVILRNIVENPGWYTQYTPYQAEIAQGRLEALLNFQTMITDLTGLPLANASLLDEGTAAAEAMAMCRAVAQGAGQDRARFFASADCHPQTLAVLKTRASGLGIELIVGDLAGLDVAGLCGALVQYPTTDGRIIDYDDLAQRLHDGGAMLVVAADPLALTLLRPPGSFGGGGADIAIGSTQRFGVPMGYGGPHAAYMATRLEFARRMPGRLIGVSRDAHGQPACRLAVQTREQHIRREKATSNICTAQVLLAVVASMYAVYHGPEGLRRIARRVAGLTTLAATALRHAGLAVSDGPWFDTFKVALPGGKGPAVLAAARQRRINLRDFGDGAVGVSFDETTTRADVRLVVESFLSVTGGSAPDLDALLPQVSIAYPDKLVRAQPLLTHPVFNRYHCEHELLRYIRRLESRDLSLTTSMISLGSCTMKLNATSQMLPITWPQFARLHPYAPAEQTCGYARLVERLEKWLAEITGMAATSLQPNAGSQGEYAGLMVIRAYHHARGDHQRTLCLIPVSAHGTNPASAVIAGMEVVPVACDSAGNVDVEDLRAKAALHAPRLAALMITYPSTHGVFEPSVMELCRIVHQHGGQVYLDGANMNAQVGLCRPGDIGADVCHLNLHKTFCIPHGGGGPGVGPICCKAHLAPYLPGHPVVAPASTGGAAISPVSAAPYGSASILPIPYVYISLMGAAGLRKATQVAILNANYMAKRLEGHYQVLFTGPNGRVAHEFIIDCRVFDVSASIKVEDIAKRLIDYGFHAPTMSWPVPGTLMIEPTESESRAELDRFCDTLIAIREEIRKVELAEADLRDNPLKNAPHTARCVTAEEWTHPYTREQAAYPAPWLKDHKFWPAVGRIDNPYGDRHLVCTCPPMSSSQA